MFFFKSNTRILTLINEKMFIYLYIKSKKCLFNIRNVQSNYVIYLNCQYGYAYPPALQAPFDPNDSRGIVRQIKQATNTLAKNPVRPLRSDARMAKTEKLKLSLYIVIYSCGAMEALPNFLNWQKDKRWIEKKIINYAI